VHASLRGLRGFFFFTIGWPASEVGFFAGDCDVEGPSPMIPTPRLLRPPPGAAWLKIRLRWAAFRAGENSHILDDPDAGDTGTCEQLRPACVEAGDVCGVRDDDSHP